jgi:hypothetical protein
LSYEVPTTHLSLPNIFAYSDCVYDHLR